MADLPDVFAALKAIALAALYPPTVTLSGPLSAGDTLSLTATPPDGPAIVGSYTVQPGDSLAAAAAGLGVAMQNAAGLLGGVTVAVNGAALFIQSLYGAWVITGSVNGAEALAIAAIPESQLSPVSSSMVAVGAGYPLPADLDRVAESISIPSTPPVPQALVTFYAPSGLWQNTTRYPLNWIIRSPAVVTLTASLDVTGTVVTLAGSTPATGQNIALIVGAGIAAKAYVHQATAADTLDTIAAALAGKVSVDTPASATGASISVPAAYALTVRIGGQGIVIKEIMRQNDRFHAMVWAPDPITRDAIAGPLKSALAATTRMTLADGMAARVITRGDFLIDDPEKIGLYQRTLLYDIEYPTTIQAPATAIILPEVDLNSAGAIVSETPTAVAPMPAQINFQLIELNELSGYTLANGTQSLQQCVIIDNLGLARSIQPAIYGNFNVETPVVFTQPGQAIWAIWDGTAWMVASWVGTL